MKQAVLITGVGKRLGLALASHLLANGYHVIGTYRSSYPVLAELQAQGADLYQVDFYQQAQVDSFIEQIKANYQSLRAIVHNASDWLPDKIQAGSDIKQAQVVEKMMSIHVGIPYQLNLALQSLLRNHESRFKDIIHISDYVAEKGSKKHMAYAASKAALNSLTMSFASLLAPDVKVNSISPAMIKFNEGDDDAYKEKALAKALLPKEAGFSEIINAIDFILASDFMTGRNLQLDGGRHLK